MQRLSAEALLFVNMREYALHAKSAEAPLFVNMGEYALNAKSAEALWMGCEGLNVHKQCLQAVSHY